MSPVDYNRAYRLVHRQEILAKQRIYRAARSAKASEPPTLGAINREIMKRLKISIVRREEMRRRREGSK